MNSIDKKQNISYIMDHECRDLIMYVDLLFKQLYCFRTWKGDTKMHHIQLTRQLTVPSCCQIPWQQERLW